MVARALAFLAGILIVQQLSVLPEAIGLLVAIIIAVIFAFLRQWLCVFFLAGIVWAVVFANIRLDNRLPEQLAGLDIPIQGIVADLPEHESNHTRFNFSVTESAGKVPNKLRLTWYYPEQTVKAGQLWAFTVRLRPPHGNFNPGGFDYERWLFVEGIGASGYIRAKPLPILLDKGEGKLSLAAQRQALVDRLDSLLADSPSLPMIKALTVGDADSLTPRQWEVFRQTGTTHLMVISGSHIGLIACLVYLLTLNFWAKTGFLIWSPQTVAALTALAAAFVYAGLTGFSVPAQRAALMVAVAMIAIVQQRNTRPFPVLFIALFAVLLIDPLVVLLPGCWLSFIAVSLIIYTLAGRIQKPGFFHGSVKINWVTSIGLAPLTLFFFQQASLIAPLANLLAVPIISLIAVPLALVATLVMLITPALAAKLFIVVDIVLQGLWWLLLKLAALPMTTISHPQPSWWALCFAATGMLLLFAPKGTPTRWLGLVMLLPLAFSAQKKPDPGTFKLTLLDVGQGLSAVVQTANHALVYDTGAKFSSTSDSGQSVIIPFLRNQDIDNIDTLIVSHGDNDHIGGIDSVLNTVKINKIITSVPALLNQYSPVPCNTGQSWVWDDVTFLILSPPQSKFMSDNDNSCVLHIQSKQGSALFPGDIEAEAEAWLVITYQHQLKADILIAPHHGSQTSSTLSFLKSVNPETILIPAGYRNQFGHPHDEVLKRYRLLNIDSFNSSHEGAIRVDMEHTMRVESLRNSEGKYWNLKK